MLSSPRHETNLVVREQLNVLGTGPTSDDILSAHSDQITASSPFSANVGGSCGSSQIGDMTGQPHMSTYAQLKSLPVHLKKHEIDLKQARKRDIQHSRHNITMSLQEQNKYTEIALAKQKEAQLQSELGQTGKQMQASAAKHQPTKPSF
jgi:hypothetical protein